ncbi:Cloroperoxidase [Hypomontagnella monticulosa]|nr:Cloroperoxidase [Hypomontagnella monticulosa]
MKLVQFPLAIGVALVAAKGQCANPWKAPGPNDFRGPCPMLNTLANHGFLPHNGRNITKETTIHAMGSALNFNESLASLMFQMAVIANPEPNATFFTLDQLNVHNVLEHDASLSRTDAFFGNNHVFNETIFKETKVYWTEPILDANMLANSKLARQINSKAFNPNYTFTETVENFSLGEVAAPIVAFGNLDAVTVNRTLVEYFFENERLPTELGWSTRSEVITIDIIQRLTQAIGDAANLITPSKAVASTRRRNLHAGLFA